MKDLLLTAVAAATVNNIVLISLLGLCPVLGRGPGIGPRLNETRSVALATTGVLTISAALSFLLDQWVLVPYELPYLRIIAFLSFALLTVQAANLIVRRTGQQLPLITTHCAVLGVMLLTIGAAQSLLGALALGFGAGLGFSVVLLLFTSLRPRLDQAPVPAALRGPAIALVTLGMMSLAVLGFSGVGN